MTQGATYEPLSATSEFVSGAARRRLGGGAAIGSIDLRLPSSSKPAQVALAPAALVLTGKRGEHLFGKCDQAASHLCELRRFHDPTTWGIVPSRGDGVVVTGIRCR